MSLAPLFSAAPQIIAHALAALAALGLGAAQVILPKGTAPHRVMGCAWVLLMALVALSSFWIHTLCQIGPFSLIHGLSLLTLVLLPVAVVHARRHHVNRHKRAMLLLFAGALVVAGFFTLLPGRIMHDVAFGTSGHRGACLPARL